MTTPKFKEKQYQPMLELKKKQKLTPLGLMANQVWDDDPKRLTFTLSRYKFVAKLISGKKKALEVGCGDAFASRIVLQEVKSLTVIDIDEIFINEIRERTNKKWFFHSAVHDILAGPFSGVYDAIYSLDVLEHIKQSSELLFIKNVIHSLKSSGVLIIGMPSLESQKYASSQSKAGHVNCKSGNDLKKIFDQFFHNVFLFSMNDEVVHTGFAPMAHYIFVVCSTPKISRKVNQA